MKRIALLLIILALAASPALAQNGPELPETAVGALALAATVLAAFGGIAASYVTDIIRQLTGLKDGEREELSKIVSPFIAAIVALAAGVLLDRGMQYAEFVDRSGLWTAIVTFGPLVFSELRYRLKKIGEPDQVELIETTAGG